MLSVARQCIADSVAFADAPRLALAPPAPPLLPPELLAGVKLPRQPQTTTVAAADIARARLRISSV
jgi:hypothetical protein